MSRAIVEPGRRGAWVLGLSVAGCLAGPLPAGIDDGANGGTGGVPVAGSGGAATAGTGGAAAGEGGTGGLEAGGAGGAVVAACAGPEGTACQQAQGPEGVCVAGACRGCRVVADCAPPPDGPAVCFSVACLDNECVYTPGPADVACEEPGCLDGESVGGRVCGLAGTCEESSSRFCQGFACNPEIGDCRESCAVLSDCIAGFFCNLPAGGICQPRLEDGEACDGLGAVACDSGYCDGQRCCRDGDCCNEPQDCPEIYAAPPSCLDATNQTSCQGTGRAKACTDHVCGTAIVQDDSACAGLVHTCDDNLASIACSSSTSQEAPVCPLDCNDGPCAPGFTCLLGACEPIAGLGEPCSGSGQGTCADATLKCENGLCCDAEQGACCNEANEATVCGGGLRCVPDAFACAESCVPNSSADCASADNFCVDGATCGPKRAQGVNCQNDGECATGHCVDNVCCESACDGSCESCFVGGGQAGVCSPISVGADPGTCDASGAGCGTSCTCSAGECFKTNGSSCLQDTECLSNNCECANGDCSVKVCNAVACGVCGAADTSVNDAFCTGARNQGTSCTGCGLTGAGACACDGQGTCDRANGQTCTTDTQCSSGNCECANSSCTARTCNVAVCGVCDFDTTPTSGSCSTDLNNCTLGGCSSGKQCIGGACVTPSCTCTCELEPEFGFFPIPDCNCSTPNFQTDTCACSPSGNPSGSCGCQ